MTVTSSQSPHTKNQLSSFGLGLFSLGIGLVLLGLFSSIGMMIAREEAFGSGARQMSTVIDNSLAQVNLEGVGPLVSVGVRDCLTKKRNQSLSGDGPGFFALDELEARGSQAYRACYIEQLESARLLSNPVELDRALGAVVSQ